MFEDPSYPLRSLRHKFADLMVNKTGTAAILSAVMASGTLGGGGYMIADEMTDNQTTEFTEAAYTQYSGNIAQLEEQYKTSVGALTTRIENGDFRGSGIQELNSERYKALESFKEEAGGVLASILLNPALSESQAEELMSRFEEHTIPAKDVHPCLEIEDYGFLREARAEASLENNGVTSTLSDIHYSVSRDANDKFEILPIMLFGMLFAFLPMMMESNRKLRDLARQKPERRVKPKH
ncbi:MAG: hypothetical protein EP349_01075 [Alphaproteobacteria bacterium]|nr:MAG: hypothetical protein EP349_01075 [Alphaproteobacteria bacterium]